MFSCVRTVYSMFRLKIKNTIPNPTHWPSEGMLLMMSESPGSVMDREQTRKYLPQAVPNSMLLPE